MSILRFVAPVLSPLALLFVAPAPAPLIANDHVHPGPGVGATSTVDADATADGDRYGLAWLRKTESGPRICFATAVADGAPDTPPIIVDALPAQAIVSAGPAIARVMQREFLVAYAFVDPDGRAEVRVARVAEDGEGGWSVVAGLIRPQPFYGPGDFADGIDVGRSADGAYVVWTIAGDLRWVGLWMNPVAVDPALHASDDGLRASKSGVVYRNPCVTSGAPAPVAFFEVWWEDDRAIAYSKIESDPEVVVYFINGTADFSSPAIAGEGGQQVLVVRADYAPGESTGDGSTRLRAYRLLLSGDDLEAVGYATEVVGLEAFTELRGPSVGQAGESRSFVAWKRFSDGAWRTEGVGLDHDLEPCEEPFELAADPMDVMPRVSESPTEPFRSLVVWGAEAPESSAPEARGATVSACE